MTGSDSPVRPRHGLVIGKFYPPHLGHLALIGFGADRCDELTVLVMASQLESIPLADRVDWLRASVADGSAGAKGAAHVTVVGIPSDAPVAYESDAAWIANQRSMAEALRAAGRPPVDVVFSSESYGDELAARFGATHFAFDVDRSRVPMSGTAARTDLYGRWSMLPPATRRGLATRIILVGAESTGTTTLANALVEHYRENPGLESLEVVSEYGRRFTYELHEQALLSNPAATMDDLVWTTEHFGLIATTQNQWENTAAGRTPLVIADTDALATKIWERRYVGPHSHAADEAAGPGLPRRDLYFVTDHEGVPFEQDGWRDGEHVRSSMTQWFLDELTGRGQSWVFLSGPHEERLAYAIRAIDPLLARRRTFASAEWADPAADR